MSKFFAIGSTDQSISRFLSFSGISFSFATLFCLVVLPSLAVHDVQRIGQVLIALLLLPLGFLTTQKATCGIDRAVRTLLVFVLLLAVFSSFFSKHFSWAAAEVSLLVIGCWLTRFFSNARIQSGERADYLFGIFVMAVCAVKSIQFIASAFAAFMSDAHYLDLDLLVVGFSNKRFYGQFQTFTLPLLALPLLLPAIKPSVKVWLFALLSCWWMIAICGGTRGTWLGMACAMGVVFISCGRWGRRWAAVQAAAAAVGVLLFWLIFNRLPALLGIEVLNFAGDRLNASLSARDILWHQAWDMIKERPLLGFGPMHFADIHNIVAAHPHQAVLQWACEWGVPSALLVMGLAGYGLLATVKLIRRNAASSNPVDLLRICLLASLTGALAQSMVDGVIVMPYSQLWMALVVGWLMGIHEWSARPTPSGPVMRWGWMAVVMLSVGFLSYVVIRDFPHLGEREDQYAHDFGGNLQPRFWQQGVIATTPQ